MGRLYLCQGALASLATATSPRLFSSCWDAAAAPASNKTTPSSRESSSSSSKSRLFIIRHGETVWNVEKRIQGHLNIALNDAGREQARRAAEGLKKLVIAKEVEVVVSSDLARAYETAEIIRESLCPGAPFVQDEGLREVCFGDLEGQLAADVAQGRDKVLDAWASGEFDAAPPGGESCNAIVERGLRALKRAAALGNGKCVVVVSHGTILRWCSVFLEMEKRGVTPGPSPEAVAILQNMKSVAVRNCSCSSLVYDHDLQNFTEASWFEDLDALGKARDDIG